mmetsp:Transcript_14674/g.32535  ORF Transcript_14674/g.32535 Transcript_14674/m.32535 type:complete len:211 (-) Transcript_14674:314-946(-)
MMGANRTRGEGDTMVVKEFSLESPPIPIETELPQLPVAIIATVGAIMAIALAIAGFCMRGCCRRKWTQATEILLNSPSAPNNVCESPRKSAKSAKSPGLIADQLDVSHPSLAVTRSGASRTTRARGSSCGSEIAVGLSSSDTGCDDQPWEDTSALSLLIESSQQFSGASASASSDIIEGAAPMRLPSPAEADVEELSDSEGSGESFEVCI